MLPPCLRSKCECFCNMYFFHPSSFILKGQPFRQNYGWNTVKNQALIFMNSQIAILWIWNHYILQYSNRKVEEIITNYSCNGIFFA